MTRYAENTSVSVEKSRAEIERTLQRYGADKFMSGWDQDKAYIAFVFQGRAYRLTLTLPEKKEFAQTPTHGWMRSPEARDREWEQACRQRWRALALVVKAKLEAIEAGIGSMEDEFLAYAILPSGQTVSQWLQPQIQDALEGGKMPVALLPGD